MIDLHALRCSLCPPPCPRVVQRQQAVDSAWWRHRPESWQQHLHDSVASVARLDGAEGADGIGDRRLWDVFRIDVQLDGDEGVRRHLLRITAYLLPVPAVLD